MFTASRRGQTFVEYGLLLSLLVIIVIVALLMITSLFASRTEVAGQTYQRLSANQLVRIQGLTYVDADIECLANGGDSVIEVEGSRFIVVDEQNLAQIKGDDYALLHEDCLASLNNGD